MAPCGISLLHFIAAFPQDVKMAVRLFEDKDHAEVYAETRPSYPDELINYIVNEVKCSSGSLNLALDAGCGSGQNTELLSKYFDQVIGIDVSEAQIKEGIKRKSKENIKYMCNPAEIFPVEDESLDLITCAASFHWFDKVAFFAEVQRALKPGGCLAIYAYKPYMTFEHEIVTKIFAEEIWDKCKSYESSCVATVRRCYYRDVEVPFPDVEWRNDFFQTLEHPLSSIFQFIKSLSFYREFHKENPDENAFLLTEDRCRKALGYTGPVENFILQYRFQYFIQLSKKQKSSK